MTGGNTSPYGTLDVAARTGKRTDAAGRNAISSGAGSSSRLPTSYPLWRLMALLDGCPATSHAHTRAAHAPFLPLPLLHRCTAARSHLLPSSRLVLLTRHTPAPATRTAPRLPLLTTALPRHSLRHPLCLPHGGQAPAGRAGTRDVGLCRFPAWMAFTTAWADQRTMRTGFLDVRAWDTCAVPRVSQYLVSVTRARSIAAHLTSTQAAYQRIVPGGPALRLGAARRHYLFLGLSCRLVS